jgi:SPP1 gp7 family putative phage head morphogenesis protein
MLPAIHPTRADDFLYDLYENILLDSHLLSVSEKRRRGVTNKKVTWVADNGDAVPDTITNGILEAPWFYDLRCAAMDSIMWGHSLIELVPGTDHPIERAKLINRINVRPEIGHLLLNYFSDSPFVDYRNDEYYSKYLIEVGTEDTLGLLLSAAYWVVIKRGAIGDWSILAELFGSPFRVGKYNPRDDYSRKGLLEGLTDMGNSGVGIIPNDSELQFMNPLGSGNVTVHKDLTELCDSQLSKLVLGQTMTTDQGSSYSQGYIHKSVEEEINTEDIIMMEYVLNWDFKNKVAALGFPEVLKGRFKIETTVQLDLKTLADIVIKLSDKIAIDKKYFYETFGIPMPDPNTPEEDLVSPPAAPAPANSPPPAGGDGGEPDPDANSPLPGRGAGGEAAQKKKSQPKATLMYPDTCCTQLPTAALEWNDLSEAERTLVEQLFHQTHNGVFDEATFVMNASKLTDAMNILAPAGYGTPDNIAYTAMEANINRFGFNKNIEQITQLNLALSQSESYNDFKKLAEGILGDFNHNYLRTEFDTAVAVSQNASNWNLQKEQSREYPFLQYQTIKDDRVRPEHAVLDGKIFDIADTSWQPLYPPNGWNCRCEMIQLSKGEAKQKDCTTGAEAKGLLGKEYTKMQKTGFAVNRGETKEIFNTNDAYLKNTAAPNMDSVNYDVLGYLAKSAMTIAEDMSINEKANPIEILKAFETDKTFIKAQKKDYLLFEDYAGRSIGLDKATLKKHLEDPYINDVAMRHKIFHNVSDILANPHEVWMIKSGNTIEYRYLKFYKDETMVVPVEVNLKEGKPAEINTWFILEPKKELKYRSGIPVKIKTD